MTKEIKCGNLLIGGDSPITIQSMTNTDTRDVKATLEQIAKLKHGGCEIIRLAVPDMEAASAFGQIKKAIKMPIVADIHFDYRLAIESIKMGADKIRINPGNIGSIDRVKKVVDAAKLREIPIRIGVNSGSLEKDILEEQGGVTSSGLVKSAIRNVKLLEDLDFDQIVVSLKASDPKMNYDSYMEMSKSCNYPLHLGVTEAGTVRRGVIKSAVGIGALLLAGIGDTIRVSLTGDPVEEIYAAKSILAAAGIRKEEINLVSCPTCGRTCVDLTRITDKIEEELSGVSEERRSKGLRPLTVAVMGCVVNGPGEAKSVDLGVACGIGEGLLFIKGKTIGKVKEEDICSNIIDMVRNYERFVW